MKIKLEGQTIEKFTIIPDNPITSLADALTEIQNAVTSDPAIELYLKTHKSVGLLLDNHRSKTQSIYIALNAGILGHE